MPFSVLYDYLQLCASLYTVTVSLRYVFFYVCRFWFWLEDGQFFFAVKYFRGRKNFGKNLPSPFLKNQLLFK